MAVFSGNGSNGSPSFTFSSDTNTGMYRVGADSIGFSTGSAVTAGYDTTLYLTDRRVLIGTSSTTSDYRFIAQARFGNTGTGAGQILVASGNADVTNGASVGIYDIGTSTHEALARFDARGNATGASPQPVSLRWFNHDGSSLNHNLTLSHDQYLRLEAGTGGIQFNGDTAAANALDDYEEGTWTPVPSAVGATTQPVYTSSGRYVRIGKLVYLTASIGVSTASTGPVTQTRILGIPFSMGTSGSAAADYQTQFTPGAYSALSASAADTETPTGAYVYENAIFTRSLFNSTSGGQRNHGWDRIGAFEFALSYYLL